MAEVEDDGERERETIRRRVREGGRVRVAMNECCSEEASESAERPAKRETISGKRGRIGSWPESEAHRKHVQEVQAIRSK